MRYSIFYIVLMLCFPAAKADIYKCEGANGQTIFSQMPCGKNQQNVTGKVNSEMPSGKSSEAENSDDYMKKYGGKVDFTGPSGYGNFSKAAAIIDVAAQKGRACEWAIKVDHKYDTCQDFMGYIVEGNRYSQASDYLTKLSKKKPNDVSSSDWDSVLRDMKNVVKYKNLVVQSFGSSR